MKTYFTHEKRYNTLNNYYRAKYNKKVCKIPLNGNFTCPNIDGTISKFGCTFCSSYRAGYFAGNKNDPLEKQWDQGVKMMNKKWNDTLYIPYFQANTNTYAPLDKLKKLYETAIKLDPNIIALSIATRPDCISFDVLNYLSKLNKKIPVQVELGLQTIHNITASKINRGYNLDIFKSCVENLHKNNIEIVVHIINGLPGEDSNMMCETIKYLNKLPINGIKIHILNILKNSKMGIDYIKKPWPVLTRKEHIDIIVNQIRLLRPDIIIHRLTGDGVKDKIIYPKWIVKKFTLINDIDKILRNNNYLQGDLYENK